MSADASQPTTPTRPQKLAIAHLLGWMVGVGAVLAIYRVAFDETDYPAEWVLFMRLSQLGFGLAYGTAIGGLGLFLWRWWRGTGAGPSQPGHWLLVFGGIGLIIDVALAGAIHLALYWSTTGITRSDFGPWMTHQVIGWWLASQIGLCLLMRLHGASIWWKAATLNIVVVLIGLAATYNVALIGFAAGAPGAWVWQLPLMVRLGGMAWAVSMLLAAAACDCLVGVRRDWLHAVGVVALSGLGLVDLIVNAFSLWR